MTITPIFLLLLSLTFVPFFAYAGTGNFGDPCNQANSRLQVGTYQFWSECNLVTYCASNQTCAHRGCRRDEFPFGYPPNSKDLPPKCSKGQFCPDEMHECQDVMPVGSPCQMNRDDQCEGPPNHRELEDLTHRGLNVNGSVCLNNVCMWANVTLGEDCVVENTAYTAYTAGSEFIDIVSRDNCRVGLYCDAQQLKCMQEREEGEQCDADKERVSIFLLLGICGSDAAFAHHAGKWVYALVVIGMTTAVVGTLWGLFWLHGKQRAAERERRLQYWKEQNAFHQNLNRMKEVARASIMSFGNLDGLGTNSIPRSFMGSN
ncbi:hypothetical protein K435DRAFT_828381 [Dendrothele bispora CBS 962.96]|uniref:Uncharacterized protein n=1 Tax=Dendrothele bispora (strain CBS 962.96) TaxID=1314807 RepID=A0A4S8M8E7_DENBC|nr:hypothetical protein K435DRAFT_828381 [Dendrothele bispora CBS 962.96]